MQDQATRVQPVQQALQLGAVIAARECFLRLPLENNHAEWLEAVLRDVYSVGILKIQVVLNFLESLPKADWTLDGCCVLHRVNETLASSTTQLHLPRLPLARFLHKLLKERNLDATTKARAERYWYEWLSPTMRAIAMGKPTVFKSALRQEVLYAAGDDLSYDRSRRNLFTWQSEWSADQAKEQWLLIPVDGQHDRFYIKNVCYEEYVYVAEYAPFGREDRGNKCSRVFTWRRTDEEVGPTGEWELLPLESANRDEFVLYNPYRQEYLYSSIDERDNKRRHVLSIGHSPDNETWLKERKWRVSPATGSPMEQGIEALFTRRYPNAVEMFTRALVDTRDVSERVKCWIYRMVANLRMGNSDAFQADLDCMELVGGANSASLLGLDHLWEEVTAFRQTERTVFSIWQSMARADHFFTHRDFEAALQLYQDVVSAEIDRTNQALRARQVEAQFAAAKCLVMLDRPEPARASLEAVLAMDDVSVEMEVRLLLWKGRCEHQMRRCNEALETLLRSFDRLRAAPECPSAAWLRQCLLTEMRVDLLSRCDTVRVNLDGPRDATSQQTLELLRCPLSLELMTDPVVTPSGHTYEREMIERHLDLNGQFDPMTRAPLTKTQLSPNRVVQQLGETLLGNARHLP